MSLKNQSFTISFLVCVVLFLGIFFSACVFSQKDSDLVLAAEDREKIAEIADILSSEASELDSLVLDAFGEFYQGSEKSLSLSIDTDTSINFVCCGYGENPTECLPVTLVISNDFFNEEIVLTKDTGYSKIVSLSRGEYLIKSVCQGANKVFIEANCVSVENLEETNGFASVKDGQVYEISKSSVLNLTSAGVNRVLVTPICDNVFSDYTLECDGSDLFAKRCFYQKNCKQLLTLPSRRESKLFIDVGLCDESKFVKISLR